MSVINQMLRELDERHVGGGSGADLKPDPGAGDPVADAARRYSASRAAKVGRGESPRARRGGWVLVPIAVLAAGLWFILDRDRLPEGADPARSGGQAAPALAAAAALPSGPAGLARLQIAPITVNTVLPHETLALAAIPLPVLPAAKGGEAVPPPPVEPALSVPPAPLAALPPSKPLAALEAPAAVRPEKVVIEKSVSIQPGVDPDAEIAAGHADAAIERLAGHLAAHPGDLESRDTLLALLERIERGPRWLDLLKDSASVDRARYGLVAARAHARAGRREAALALLEEIPPAARNGAFERLYGVVLASLGFHPQALDAFARALAEGPAIPDQAAIRLARAASLESLGRRAEARRELESLLEPDSGVPASLREHATTALARLGE